MPTFAAVDIGASGGRVMRGVVDDERVDLEAVHRFPNGAVRSDRHLRWDLAELHRQVVHGLALIPDATSIGIDMWGVDYGLLDGDGHLIADPIAHRDDRTGPVIDTVHTLVSPEELYTITGIQHLPFNTIYQLAADEMLSRARHVVLLPDLLAYLLTGNLGSELTNASTTALLDARTRRWSASLLDRLGAPRELLPPIEHPGTQRGTLGGTPVVTVGSHDTASAVAGIHATTPRFAYISSGTWSLVGLLLDEPVLTAAAQSANFTNEIAVDGRVRFLRNVGGLWLLQECLRAWRRDDDDLDLLLHEAASLPASNVPIDVDDPAFIPPGRMPERIAEAAGTALNQAETVRCILDSLAAGYARTVRQATDLSGHQVDVIQIVGGGCRNELLCQLTAEASGLPVLSGPAEATALGNVLVQARTCGLTPSPPTAFRRYEPA